MGRGGRGFGGRSASPSRAAPPPPRPAAPPAPAAAPAGNYYKGMYDAKTWPRDFCSCVNRPQTITPKMIWRWK